MPDIVGTLSQLDNACRAINDGITLLFAATNLLMFINLLSSVKASMHSFVDCQLIFLKFEQSNTMSVNDCFLLSIIALISNSITYA